MKIMIGNDHGGYKHKLSFVVFLKSKGIEVVDIGTDSEKIVRYPYYAAKTARAVATGEVDRGILICSTGIGMSIAANRFRGVRASLCTNAVMGKLTRAHNNSNLLCLGGKITNVFEAIEILQVWLDTPYEGGRHDISLGIIGEIEETVCLDADFDLKTEK